MRAVVAKPREARGWFVYGVAVAASFLALAIRLRYSDGTTPPYFFLTFLDPAFLVAAIAVVIAGLGLQQALWYSLIKPAGMTLYAASLLMFGVALMLFYSLPDHLGRRDLFLAQFIASLILFAYVPTLSYGSKVFVSIGVAGGGGLLAVSLYGPALGSASFLHPIIVATLALEGALVLALLRLLQVTFQRPRAAAA